MKIELLSLMDNYSITIRVVEVASPIGLALLARAIAIQIGVEVPTLIALSFLRPTYHDQLTALLTLLEFLKLEWLLKCQPLSSIGNSAAVANRIGVEVASRPGLALNAPAVSHRLTTMLSLLNLLLLERV